MNATHNIADLNNVLAEYQRLRGMSNADVLQKQGAKLGREIYFQLRAIAPAKWAVRAELLARLKAGKGIKIRPWVREKNDLKMTRHWVRRFGFGQKKLRKDAKKLNFQNELVKREIGARESGRGVLGISIRYSPKRLVDRMGAISRYGKVLSVAGVVANSKSGFAQFRWDERSEMSKSVMQGIARPRARAAIQRGIDATRADILKYVRGEHVKTVKKSAKKLVRQNTLTGAALEAEIRRVMAGK